ncbi:CD109 antigen-like [Diaphorina citri]|uniref:CD109 antigen-like n=1 Tax=Diaphorina citri TaxID=121845 RepID=A0A1S3DCR8_DIACI|nr:CD109 antigen-like [Diaphorina citri]
MRGLVPLTDKPIGLVPVVIVIQISLVLCMEDPVFTYVAEPHHKPTYSILFSKILRPATLYSIVTTFHQSTDEPYMVSLDEPGDMLSGHTVIKASIACHSGEVVAGSLDISSQTSTLTLRIPPNIKNSSYSLRVQGVSTGRSTLFEHISHLVYSPNYLSITVQTSRPIYSSGQLVKFRVLILQTDLLPYNDDLDVFVLDPDGIIMRRWISIYTNNGVSSLSFQLPNLAKDGTWLIRTSIQDQINEHRFQVQTYFTPLFEKEGKNTVLLNFSELLEPVTPGLELRLDVTVTELLSGESMTGFSSSRVVNSQVVVEFVSRRPLYWHAGKPIQGHVSVSYSDGQPLSAVDLEDSQLTVHILLDGAVQEDQTILVKREHDYSETENYMTELTDSARWDMFVERVRATFTRSPSSDPITTVRTVYTYANPGTNQDRSQEGNETRAGSIVVWTNPGEEIGVEDYVVAHVKTEAVPDGFTSVVLSKNLVLRTEYHPPSPSPLITSISVPVSPDMAPVFTYVVYAVTRAGHIISDSVTVPVSGFNRYEQTMALNMGKDYRGLRVEGIASGDEGAFIGFHAMRSASYLMQAGNELTLSRVMQSYEDLDTNLKFIEKLEKNSRDGTVASELFYLTTQNQARDSIAAFHILNLGLFTNAEINQDSSCSEDEEYCASEGCYNKQKTCDHIQDCVDGTDEISCTPLLTDPDDRYFYSVKRSSRNFFTFDAEEGDWGWREIRKNDHEGIEFEPLWSPSTGDAWYFTAFSVSKTLGFSILSTPELFSSRRPVMAQLTGVASCKRGEQVSLRLSIHNMLHEQMLVEVVLRGSSQYKFVHVEENGIVSSYGARLSSGDHQILIYLDPQSQERVDIPVAPVIDQGHVKVTVEVITQAGHVILHHDLTVLVSSEGHYVIDQGHVKVTVEVITQAGHVILHHDLTVLVSSEGHYVIDQGHVKVTVEVITQAGHVILHHDLTVLGEGMLINRHTSIFLDLKSRALVLNYLDICVEETPLVPYEIWRRYVYGSPGASIMLSRFNRYEVSIVFISMPVFTYVVYAVTRAGHIISDSDSVTVPVSGFNRYEDEEYCASEGCYNKQKTCDHIQDCVDGTDEISCTSLLTDPDDRYFYSVKRSSRNFFTFDAEEGDWGWREIRKNDHEGIEFEPLWSPSTGDDWYFTAFSVSKTLGFSILSTPELVSTSRYL